MKRIFAILLAVVMVLSLSVAAFAADGGKITVTNATDGHNYTAYEILSLESFNKATNEYSYKITAKWAAFAASDAIKDVYLSVSEDDGTASWVTDVDDETIAEFAKLAIAYAKANNVAGDAKATATGTTAVFENLEQGWYLVDSSVGTICSIDTTDAEVTIADKNVAPTIDKDVKEDSTNAWADENTVQVGDVVDFKITVTKQAGAVNYVVHDKMDAGLTLLADTIATDDANATVSTSCTDGCTFEVAFSNAYIATLDDGATTVVTYKAQVNENAISATNVTENKAVLSYGDDDDTTVTHETEETKTETKVFNFDIVKTNANGVVLQGAQFKLYLADKTTEVPVVKVSDGVYRVAVEGETGVEMVAGTVTVKGLDSDVYYLEETVAPVAYNKLQEKVKVKIDGANLVATVNDNHYVSGGVQVINNSGTELPATGGMGTTIFTVVGLVMIVLAAVILFARKRMSYSL